MFLDLNDATEMIFLNSLLSHAAQKLHSAAFQTFCLGAATNQGKAGLKGEELKMACGVALRASISEIRIVLNYESCNAAQTITGSFSETLWGKKGRENLPSCIVIAVL